MVGFERQHIVCLLVCDLGRDVFLAAHGVDGDDASLDVERAQQLGDRRDLVGLVVDFDLSQHQAVVRRPCADDIGDGRAFVQRAAQRFAIDGDHIAGERRADALNPFYETVQKRIGVDGGKHAVERVARRDAVGQFEKRLEPIHYIP